MAYVQRPFSSYRWHGAGAELGGSSYAPQPYRYTGDNFQYTFKPFATGTKNYRVYEIGGDVYLLTFSRWSYDSQSTFSNWQGRITERTETVNGYTVQVLDVDGSQTAATHSEYYGGDELTVTAHYELTLLQPGDPHYDETPESPSASDPDDYEEEERFAWVICTYGPEGVLSEQGSKADACAYHEIATSYRDGTGVHYGYWGHAHNLPGGPDGTAHRYSVDDTVRIGVHADNLERPYARRPEHQDDVIDWRFGRWELNGNPNTGVPNPVYSYSDGSCGFVLTEAIVDAHAGPADSAARARYGIPMGDPVIRLKAALEPTLYSRLIMEIAEGSGHGAMRPMYWKLPYGDPATQFVTVVRSTPDEYEARVPSLYYPTTDKQTTGWIPVFFPRTAEGFHVYKYTVATPDGTSTHDRGATGYFDDGSDEDCEELWYQIARMRSGDQPTVTIRFHIRTDHVGELLCTGEGSMLCDASGRLMYAG